MAALGLVKAQFVRALSAWQLGCAVSFLGKGAEMEGELRWRDLERATRGLGQVKGQPTWETWAKLSSINCCPLPMGTSESWTRGLGLSACL